MTYRVFIYPSVQKELERLPQEDYERVRDVLLSLAQDPRPPGCTKLRKREGWRVRQGDYRVIYAIDDAGANVTVLRVRHRRDAYR